MRQDVFEYKGKKLRTTRGKDTIITTRGSTLLNPLITPKNGSNRSKMLERRKLKNLTFGSGIVSGTKRPLKEKSKGYLMNPSQLGRYDNIPDNTTQKEKIFALAEKIQNEKISNSESLVEDAFTLLDLTYRYICLLSRNDALFA